MSGRRLLHLLLAGALAALLIAMMARAYYQLHWDDAWDQIRVEEAHHVQLQGEVLSGDLRHIAYTLAFLRNQVGAHLPDPGKGGNDSFTFDLLSFINTSDLYDQIRLLDVSGMELARVDYNNGQPLITPDKQLQFKGNSAYFKQAVKLNPGEIYISPLDLNIEHGQVERPFKPVMRFAMPVLDKAGQRQGLLILNFRAASILDDYHHAFRQTAANSQLLNRDGFWLYHPESQRMWGHVLPERAAQNMAMTAPDRWRKISSAQSGQFVDQGRLISFASMQPLAEMMHMKGLRVHAGAEKEQWKVVSSFPVVSLTERMQGLAAQMALAAVLFFVAVLLLLVLLFRSREREAVFRQALLVRSLAMDASPIGIVMCDARRADLPITYCNAAFERLSGYHGAEVLGQNCRFMQGEERAQPEVALMRQAIAKGQACMVTLRNYRADGTMFWDEVTIAPVHQNGGVLSHFIGYHQDVSERVQAGEKQQQMLDDIKCLSRSLLKVRDEELQSISRHLHDDIGQMTTVLMLHAQLAEVACQSGDQEKIVAAVAEIGRTVQLLMQSVRSSLKAIHADFLDGLTLRDQLEKLCANWRSPDLSIALEMDEGLGDVDSEHAAHIYHMVQEALNNIVRHAQASRVMIQLQRKERMLMIMVKDNGCGFDTENMQGAMGLTGMRERIEAMGGSWQLESHPGGGTTVSGMIPVEAEKKENP
ncbi:MAG: PAS domain-containing protein [Mariprofundus sp.]